MKKTSKFLSIILAILMVISIIPITASAEELITSGHCGENLTWAYDSSTYTLTISGTGDMYDYKSNNRPWESYEDDIKVIVIEDGVTTIGKYAFYHCGKLVTATLPDSVTSIGEYVFRECKKLKNINIPDGVEIIKAHTFNYCDSLESITIPNGVTEIGESAFYGCDGLVEITIPDSVTTISKTAFEYCDNLAKVTFGKGLTVIDKFAFAYCNSLENVTIPSNVTSIETGAFAGCENLLNITVDSNNPYFSNDENGILFNKDKTILIQYPLGSDVAKYTIPDSVSQIGRWSFYSCSKLSELTIPNSVTVIGYSAFSYKQAVIIYYEGTAEQWNNALEKSNDIPTHWYDDYYIICSDKTIYPSGTCGENVTWEFNKVTGVLTISGIGAMDNYEFRYTGFYEQPWESFSDSIKEVVVEDGITKIGNCAFASFDNLTTISISNSVTTIGKEALYDCENLSNVTIGDGVTTIGEKAFYYCTSLTSMVIPINVTSIGDNAFVGCSGITDVYYEGTEEQWNDNFVIYNGYITPPTQPFGNATIHYNYHIHRYSSTVTAPNCTEQGYTTYTCECGNSYIDDYVDAKGHSYKDGVCVVCSIFTGIKDDHFYKDDVMQKAYHLVEFEGDFYYIGDRHEIVKNKKVYLTEAKINGLTYADGTPISVGYYEFDENGKMIILNGIVGNKIYKNNTMLKAYQLVEIDGEFYYIGDRHEIIKGRKAYVKADRINGLTYADGTPIEAGWYEFDEDGKMVILNGIVGNHIYKNNTMLKAYQLVEIDGDIYYIGDRHEIIKGRKAYVKAERTNGLTFPDGTPITAGYYEFDENGKMIIE